MNKKFLSSIIFTDILKDKIIFSKNIFISFEISILMSINNYLIIFVYLSTITKIKSYTILFVIILTIELIIAKNVNIIQTKLHEHNKQMFRKL